jgi:hypothetical protein
MLAEASRVIDLRVGGPARWVLENDCAGAHRAADTHATRQLEHDRGPGGSGGRARAHRGRGWLTALARRLEAQDLEVTGFDPAELESTSGAGAGPGASGPLPRQPQELAMTGLENVTGLLFDIAARVSDNRVVAGIHYPVDIAAGKAVAIACFEKLRTLGDASSMTM